MDHVPFVGGVEFPGGPVALPGGVVAFEPAELPPGGELDAGGFPATGAEGEAGDEEDGARVGHIAIAAPTKTLAATTAARTANRRLHTSRARGPGIHQSCETRRVPTFSGC